MITQNSVDLFKKAASLLPAYRNHLLQSGFDPSTVHSENDFSKIPVTSKKTYLQLNKRQDLIWPEDLRGPLSFCSTSGSTGEPYYFPRNEQLSRQASIMAEEFLRQSSYGSGRTLVIMGLGMGVWIGGLITLRAFEIAAERMNAPIAFLAPGYNKTEIFKALKNLAPEFEQTILVGYPPFLKELIDEFGDEGIHAKSLHLRLMFAAEAFTETYRKYVAERTGITQPLLDTMNIYGTADIGAMAHETPLSILVRRLVLEDPLLYKDMFGQIEKTPTLCQYRPEFVEFEEVNGELILTGNAAIPLIRYAVGDSGGVKTYDNVERLLLRYGINLKQEIQKAGISHTVRHSPFVFVYERTDLSTTLHGVNIYPEFIKEGLLKPIMLPYFTEKFTMATKHDIHHNQFLQLNLELRKNIEASEELEVQATKIIRKALIEKSSEFAEIAKSQKSANILKIVLWPHEHPRYFAPGTKQKWVEKV